MRSRRIVLAMSGGVDSSGAAVRLLREGYEVIGVTLRMDAKDTRRSDDSVVVAQEVAAHLGIPLRVLDATARFRVAVLRPSWDAYAGGRTPNPCVLCNPTVKLDALIEVARQEGAQWVATGHYARVVRNAGSSPCLLRAGDRSKDQSYFLFALTNEHLSQALFPLGDMTKHEVRRLAVDSGLPSADDPESQDVCVVGLGEAFPEVLRVMFGGPDRPGRILTPDGAVIGHHDGIHLFTIGQRRGIGIALGNPAWVAAIDPMSGDVMVSTERSDLLADGLQAERMRWHGGGEPPGPIRCHAQVRYGQLPVPARVTSDREGGALIRLEQPVWAVTPGQAVVLYEGDMVRGGGWIRRAIRDSV